MTYCKKRHNRSPLSHVMLNYVVVYVVYLFFNLSKDLLDGMCCVSTSLIHNTNWQRGFMCEHGSNL